MALLLAVPAVHASEVSFTGGFTSFRGPVATAPGADAAVIHTEINGVTVYADEPLSPEAQYGFDNFGLGIKNTSSLLDAGGNPIAAVEFSRIFYSSPNPNAVAFTPAAPQDLSAGDEFTIGTFSVTNGSWFGNSPGDDLYPDTDFGFTVTTVSSDPLLDGFTFSDTLRFVVTGPTDPLATVEDDADYFYFVGRPDLGTIRVFEATTPSGEPTGGNSGTVELRVRIGSLVPTSLANASGAAFIGAPVPEVPEPGAWLLAGAGLAVLAAARRRRAPRAAHPLCCR